jgi:hypothetical protein
MPSVGSRKNFQSFTIICRKPHIAISICLRATTFQNSEGTLWTYCTTLLLTKLLHNLSKLCCHLLHFNVSTTDGSTDVETKLNFTPHPREHIPTGTAAIAAVILRRKSERDSTLSLCTMSLTQSQKNKCPGVTSGICGGQLIDPSLSIHRPGNRPSRAVRTVAP